MSQLNWVLSVGAEFWPPTFWLSLLFFFASSFILFFFPRLTLFTIFFTLHFILHPTIYSLKNYFPKLLNTPSFISLNFFLDPCVLEHFCYTSIFWWNTFSNSSFLCTKMSSSSNGPYFLLFMERNIIHHLNGMMRRGFFKTPWPYSTFPHGLQGDFFFGFFVWKNVVSMLHWKFDGETLSFCCVL